MIFKSYGDLSCDIYRNVLPKLPPGIKMVAGVPRSGMFAATIISEALQCELGAAIGGKIIPMGHGRRGISGTPRKYTIVVDDAVTSGRSLKPFEKFIPCAVYCDINSRGKITKSIIGEYVDIPFLGEWQFMGVNLTAQYMVDMDGVLCEDFTGAFPDEGPRFIEWMAKTRPLFLPLNGMVHTVCTGRYEKWRDHTTAWLRKHVRFQKLAMCPAGVKRWEHKAETYAKSDCVLFVESDLIQAERIHDLTKKPVLSIEKMRFFKK
jgi:hypothetical protein